MVRKVARKTRLCSLELCRCSDFHTSMNIHFKRNMDAEVKKCISFRKTTLNATKVLYTFLLFSCQHKMIK